MASSPERHPWSISAWGAISAGLHAVLFTGVLWFASRAPDVERVAEESITYIVFPAEVPAPVELPVEPPPPPPADEPVRAEPRAQPEPPSEPEPLPLGFQELEIPREIPVTIPPPSAFSVRAIDYTGVGVRGGTGEGYVAPLETPAEPVRLAVVDRPPEMKNVEELAQRMRALYPPLYRAAGIDGRAVIELVVDTEGRVERDGMSIISATHPEFGPASLELVRLLRFEPARRNGRPVRVWVRLPVDWKVD